MDSMLSNIEVKIDTGCAISTIPLAKFKALSYLCDKLKYNDIENNIEYLASYGVETGGEKHDTPVTDEEKMKCTALKFKHKVENFEIAGVSITTQDYLFVNYNRKGNILIGMDIMKNWDIHIGTIDTGETIFLVCPKDQLNEEYFRELNRLFHIGDEILSAEM